MNFKTQSIAFIAISILAALAILVTSELFEEASQTIMFFIIAIWWIPFTWFITKNKTSQCKQDKSGSEVL